MILTYQLFERTLVPLCLNQAASRYSVVLSLTWKRDFFLPDNMVTIFLFLVLPLVSLVIVSEKCVL